MWKDYYRIGVEQIDEQHRQLFLYVEELLRAAKQDDETSRAACCSTMVFLKNYVVVHFNTEKLYQQSIGFEGRAQHHLLHQDFVRRLRELEFELIRSNYSAEVIRTLASALTSWLVYHVMIEDRKMAAATRPPADKQGKGKT